VHSVARGAIGNALGPYAHHHLLSTEDPAAQHAVTGDSGPTVPEKRTNNAAGTTTATLPAFMWDAKDPDADDPLHNPDPVRDARLDASFDPFSLRGWANVSILILIAGGLIIFFAGYPIINFYISRNRASFGGGFNLGGVNSTGQIPNLPGIRPLIDNETPDNVKTRTGFDGKSYKLVFSDEFNTDNRTFWPGDDPYWEAMDLYYWPTVDLEWYDPRQITTQGGNLVITMEEVVNHNLHFRSGMLQSWNKFCFTTGYIEVSISLPGSGEVPGNWAAAWTMGNLGRPGYGATTEGMWPYTYDSCDVGTFPNQTNHDGTPAAASNSGAKGGELSFLPGQRVSACTCPGSDHPGPNEGVGRGVPEVDIIEAQVDLSVLRGQASQSNQIAPFSASYNFDNSSVGSPIYDDSLTSFNNYKGGVYQQAVSAVSYLDNADYAGNSFQTYGYELWSDPSHRDQGYITWSVGNTKTWTLHASAIGPDADTGVQQRLIAEEPMSIVLNFGMSPGFQGQDFKNLKFPSQMLVDYVRVYQRTDHPLNVGCDTTSHPTADYINKHANAYNNPNLTTWNAAGYKFPRNSLYDGC